MKSESQAAMVFHATMTGEYFLPLDPGWPSMHCTTNLGTCALVQKASRFLPSSLAMSANWLLTLDTQFAKLLSSTFLSSSSGCSMSTIASRPSSASLVRHPCGRKASALAGAASEQIVSRLSVPLTHMRTAECGLLPASLNGGYSHDSATQPGIACKVIILHLPACGLANADNGAAYEKQPASVFEDLKRKVEIGS